MAKVLVNRWQSTLDAQVKDYLNANGVDADKLFNLATGYDIIRNERDVPMRIPVWEMPKPSVTPEPDKEV